MGDLEVIEEFLGHLFMPAFAKSIVNKQLQDLGETRETYTRNVMNRLLNNIETKVLLSFQGDNARNSVVQIRKSIEAGG